jgi:hypothetical protein
MRPVTRNLVIAIVVVVVALLALGALPSYLGSGEPYHLTAEETTAEGPAVDVTNVTDRRYPYLTEALESEDGRSAGYREGPFGIKEHFTHTPFDEVDALRQRSSAAVAEDGRVLVTHEGERYYLEVTRGDS